MFTDSFVCVADADHPDLGSSISLAQFQNLPHAVTRLGKSTSTITEAALRSAGIEFEAAIVAPHFTAVLAMLPGTRLIATVQNRLFVTYGQPLGLRALSLPIPVPALAEEPMWHPRHDFDPGHLWIRELLIEVGRAL